MGPQHQALVARAESIAKYGALTLDRVLVEYSCSGCSAPVDDPHHIVLGAISYNDLSSLRKFASSLTKSYLTGREVRQCPACASPASVVHVDYHSYLSPLGRDLVIRCAKSKGLFRSVEESLLWWQVGTGYNSAEPLSDHERDALEKESFVRRAATAVEVSGIEAAVGEIELAANQSPGHPALLQFVQPLISIGRTGLAGAIADGHIAARPDDPDGHFWLAEIVIQVVNNGAWPPEKLVEASEELRTALSLRPDFPEAECAACNVLRLDGDEDAARGCFEALISKYPERGEARYNLAQMLSERDPESALQLIRDGEEITPGDADYPLAAAKLLIRLGRIEEARAALDRGKQIDPDHPKLRAIESAIPDV